MKHITISQSKQDLAKCLKIARSETVVITSRGKPTGLLIALEDADDLWGEQLVNDPRFVKRITQARASARSGKSIPLEQIDFKAAKVKPQSNRKRRP